MTIICETRREKKRQQNEAMCLHVVDSKEAIRIPLRLHDIQGGLFLWVGRRGVHHTTIDYRRDVNKWEHTKVK